MRSCIPCKVKVTAATLKQGEHAKRGNDLETQPRRITKRDVGTPNWGGVGTHADGQCVYIEERGPLVQDGSPKGAALSECSLGTEHSLKTFTHLTSLVPTAEEEDPLGLGIDLF